MANELIEKIAQQWDGCMYASAGRDIDIGQAIRDAAKDLATPNATTPEKLSDAGLWQLIRDAQKRADPPSVNQE